MMGTESPPKTRYPDREELIRVIEEGITAFDLTRQYLGDEALPAIEGWSWFDWTEKAKEVLRRA